MNAPCERHEPAGRRGDATGVLAAADQSSCAAIRVRERVASGVRDAGVLRVDRAVAVREHAAAPLEVAAGEKRAVERADRLEHRLRREQIRGRSELPLRDVPVLVEVHDDEVVELGRGRTRGIAKGQLDVARHESTVRARAEARDTALDPVGRRNAVGIGEREDLAPRDREPPVARRIGARLTLADQPHEGNRATHSAEIFARAVVDDDYLVAIGPVALISECAEAAPQSFRVVEDRDDDRNERLRRARHDPPRRRGRSRPDDRSGWRG